MTVIREHDTIITVIDNDNNTINLGDEVEFYINNDTTSGHVVLIENSPYSMQHDYKYGIKIYIKHAAGIYYSRIWGSVVPIRKHNTVWVKYKNDYKVSLL